MASHKADAVKAKLLDKVTAGVKADDADRYVSMKRTAKQKKGSNEPVPMPPGEDYPWGLRLSLNKESLDKLGMSKLPRVGETFELEAKVQVVAVSENKSLGGDQSRSVDLQITDCCLE